MGGSGWSVTTVYYLPKQEYGVYRTERVLMRPLLFLYNTSGDEALTMA